MSQSKTETEFALAETLRQGLGAHVDSDTLPTTRYESLELLGRGGMGEVDLLRDHRIGRDVARKRMRTRDASVLDITRFLREATLQGQLEHPAIVPVYDLARGEEGPYFTMKRIRGVTLEAILSGELNTSADSTTTTEASGESWSTRALLGAFVQVAQAIHFAHTRGVVHRDLKPANVMLGEFGEVYVLDWGLAKHLEAEGEAPSAEAPRAFQSTEAGEILGTLGYIAPEQIEAPSHVTPAADVYSLAAILFEILAGAPLHARVSAPQLLVATLVGVDVEERVSALSKTSPIHLPPEFIRLIQACVALKPSARPQHASELAQRVQQFLDGDRDLELRKGLAEKHRARANELIRQAANPDEATKSLDHRRDAIREVGRALALDASNDSLRTLVSLLESPPEQVPPEVEAKLVARDKQKGAMLSRHITVSWLSFFVVVPLAIWCGILHWLVLLGLLAIAVFNASRIRRRLDAEQRIPTSSLLLGAVFIAGTSLVVGPLFFAPLTAMAVLAPWMTVGARPQRAVAVAFALLGLATPLLLAAVGVLPMPYEFIDGNLVIHPYLVAFNPLPTYALIIAASLALVFSTAKFAHAFRAEVDRSTEEAEFLVWHLRQLVPAHANEPARRTSEPLPKRPTKPTVTS